MRVVQLPVDVIEGGGILLILFPGFIPVLHHIEQLRIVLAVPVEPDAEFSVDLIHMHPVGVFEIKQGIIFLGGLSFSAMQLLYMIDRRM